MAVGDSGVGAAVGLDGSPRIAGEPGAIGQPAADTDNTGTHCGDGTHVPGGPGEMLSETPRPQVPEAAGQRVETVEAGEAGEPVEPVEAGEPEDAWSAYAHVARELAAVRAGARARHGSMENVTDQVIRQAGQLGQLLADQGRRLGVLAEALHQPQPWLGPVGTGGSAAPAQWLADAVDACDRAAASVAAAEQRAARSLILPDLPASARNMVIYAMWAFAGWLAQCGVVMVAPAVAVAAQLAALGVLPFVSFLGGYLTVTVAGRPRLIKGDPAAIEQTRSPVLGAVICFLALPLGWVLLIAAQALW